MPEVLDGEEIIAMKSRRIATIIDGKREVHMVGGPHDYDTACGLDMNDPEIGHYISEITETTDKIDCPQCRVIWQDARLYKLSDFKNGA